MSFGKKDSLTIKGVAIIFMLLYHLFAEPSFYAGFQLDFMLPENLIVYLASFGNICVSIFLLISAYGITISLRNVNSSSALVKRTMVRFGILVLQFLVMYLSIWLIWFSKLKYSLAYGTGVKGIIFGVIDALGFAEIFHTPTLCMTWWYMGVAIICIFMVPFLLLLYRKTGIVVIGLFAILPVVFSVDFAYYRYFFVMVLGVCAAEGNWINQYRNWNIGRINRVLVSVFLMVIAFYVYLDETIKSTVSYLSTGVVALVWVIGLYVLVAGVPILSTVLQFFGMHSMNIFFFHTFIFLILYRDQIYGLRHPILIFIVLLGISTLYSVMIEFVKRKLAFYKLIQFIKEKNNG